MKNKLMEALQNASKEELIDIIEERMYMDPAFRKTIEHRFVSDAAADPDQQILSFQNQVDEEVAQRYPNTSIIRAAVNALNRQMENWNVYDCCRGCIAIIRTLDSALANGAGMEDDTDFEISLDVEAAAEYAKDRIRKAKLPDIERKKITDLIQTELKTPLDVYGEDIFVGMLDIVNQ